MNQEKGRSERERAGREGFSIRRTASGHQADPAHRFHDVAAPRDFRINVASGEARQRLRGRHWTGPR